MAGYIPSSLRKPAAQWTVENPILGATQFGQETDTRRIKQGNNRDPWNSLPYSTAISVDSDGRIGLPSQSRPMVVTKFKPSSNSYPRFDLYPSTNLYPSTPPSYPSVDLYPATTLYPSRLYPSTDVYPSTSLEPAA